jgi:hypothetical protein
LYRFSVVLRLCIDRLTAQSQHPWRAIVQTNESAIDRGIRIVIALAAVVGAFAVGAGSVLGIVLFVVALIMVVTAAVGFCPLYRIFGMSTCKLPAGRS